MSFLFNLARDHFSRPKQPKQRSVQSSFDLTFHVKHLIDLQGEAQHRQRQAHHPVKQSAGCFNTTNLFSAFMFHVKHGFPGKSDKIKRFTWNKPAYKITPRFYRTGYPGPLAKRHTVSPPRSSARTQRHSVWVLPPKALPQSLQLVFETLIFRLSRFYRLLICFSPVCTAILQKNCFTWNNQFKDRKNSPKKIGIQDQPAPFIKCEHSVLIGK